MIDFELYNNNPKNKKTGDCVVRALTLATNRPYLEVYKDLFEISCKTGWVLNDKKVAEKFLEKNGFVKYKQPRKWDNTKYQIGELDDLVGCEDTVVVLCANHMTCVCELTLYDLWDCRGKCISNYYIKEE